MPDFGSVYGFLNLNIIKKFQLILHYNYFESQYKEKHFEYINIVEQIIIKTYFTIMIIAMYCVA